MKNIALEKCKQDDTLQLDELQLDIRNDNESANQLQEWK